MAEHTPTTLKLWMCVCVRSLKEFIGTQKPAKNVYICCFFCCCFAFKFSKKNFRIFRFFTWIDYDMWSCLYFHTHIFFHSIINERQRKKKKNESKNSKHWLEAILSGPQNTPIILPACVFVAHTCQTKLNWTTTIWSLFDFFCLADCSDENELLQKLQSKICVQTMIWLFNPIGF